MSRRDRRHEPKRTRRAKPITRRKAKSGAVTYTFQVDISDDSVAVCWLLTLAGLRRSEILGLRWADVNFDAGTVTVAQGRVVVAGQRSRSASVRANLVHLH